MINRDVRLRCTTLIYEDKCDVVSNIDNDMDDNFSRNRGGHPVGTTIVSKHEIELRRVKVHNDISIKYAFEKRSLPYDKILPRGCFNEIIEGITSKYGLYSSNVYHITIRQRATRSDDKIVYRMHGGHISPMTIVEDKLVGLLIKTARIRHLLTPSSCLKLANDFITGTHTEKDVIDIKNKYYFNESDDDESLLGRFYFKCFKKRNYHRIVSKRGQKYEMDRDNWTTYRNFSKMYNHVIEEMCNDGVAEKLDYQIWMNRDGEECQPIEAFGCKVTHRIKHPDMCIVGDEVGCNSSRKSDGHIGGTLYSYEKMLFPNLKRPTKINTLH